MTFTKLFGSITESTIWAEPDHTRLVWITMLAMADHAGRVWGSIPGLANRARVPLEKCEEALQALQSPDKYSRTKAHEGRRIEDIDGGWRLLNHAKYRDIRDEESRKESKRRYINGRRAAERIVTESGTESTTMSTCRQSVSTVDQCRPNAEADTEAYTEAEVKNTGRKRASAAPPVTVEFLVSDGLTEELALEWLAHRKRKRAVLTPAAWAGIKQQASKAGWSASEVVAKALMRGWTSFEAGWVANDRPGAPASKQAALEARNAATVAKMRGALNGEE